MAVRPVFRRALGAVRDLRARRPEVRLTDHQETPPTVYFLAPDFAAPSGGVRVMYRQVDVLNQVGIRAAALHQKPGFRCTWFDNSTVVAPARTPLGPRDVLVVPELDVDVVAALPAPVNHIVLNQSGHLSWSRATETVLRHYAGGQGLLGVVTVSEHSAAMMRYALPGVEVRRARPSVDPAVFFPGPGPRERVISYLPRRGVADITQVVSLLRARDALPGWQVAPLELGTQTHLATQLRRSRITLSLSYQEGFGLPAAEAMACGNYVIGFHGFGGREFFRPEFSAAVATGDVMAAAVAVEEAVRRDAAAGSALECAGNLAAEFIHSEYSPLLEQKEIAEAYSDLLEQCSARKGTFPGGER